MMSVIMLCQNPPGFGAAYGASPQKPRSKHVVDRAKVIRQHPAPAHAKRAPRQVASAKQPAPAHAKRAPRRVASAKQPGEHHRLAAKSSHRPSHPGSRPATRTARSRSPVVAVMDLRPLIVIDPGHGGRDPGAVGVLGTLEKNVTLATGLELRRQLLMTRRYRVELTRPGDVFVPLAARVAFARSHDAALFIAIHADSSGDHRARGASVYVRKGDSGTVKTTKVTGTKTNSKSIANAMAATDPGAQPNSAWLQKTVVASLNGDVRMAVDPSRKARFYVLGATSTPSVLLEMGFLSNRRDEALLNRVQHRKIIAAALRDAINDYFEELRQTAANRT
jgi:N-acetylmuramoyl-L-alanine amidase